MNRARRIAILVAEGIDVTGAQAIHAALVSEGVEPRFVGPRAGVVRGGNGADLEVQDSLDGRDLQFDALVLPEGDASARALMQEGQAVELVKSLHRERKPILAVGAGTLLLEAARLPLPDPGLLVAETTEEGARSFVAALHRAS